MNLWRQHFARVRLDWGFKHQRDTKSLLPAEILLRHRARDLPGIAVLPFVQHGRPHALRFAFEENIPFTNNQAERDIRPIKVKLKMATNFRSGGGAEAFLCIKSVFSTITKNGLNILDSILTILENPHKPFNFSSAWVTYKI